MKKQIYKFSFPNFYYGFTLVELLFTLVIIAILISIAVGFYKQYIIKVENSKAIYDLRNLINAEIAYFAKNLSFVAFSIENIQSNGSIIKGNFFFKGLSQGVLAVAKTSANKNYLNICTKSIYGNKIYCYESEKDTIFYKISSVGKNLTNVDCPNATKNFDCKPPIWQPLH